MQWSDKQKRVIGWNYCHAMDVLEGTPRSGKTTAAVARAAYFYWNTPDKNHMVLAYNQEQAYKLVMDCDGFGLIHIFNGVSEIRHDEDYGDHLFIQTPAGEKRIYYKGAGKGDSHKAFTGLSLGSVFFCEINLLHMNAIQEAFRRTMAAKVRWHIADLNPPPPNHPVITEVFNVQDTRWTHWTPEDNPALTDQRKKELHDTLAKNRYLFARDWLGERVIPEGVIYSMFDPKRHILPTLPDDVEIVEMFFAGDGGLTDATSISCNLICRPKILDTDTPEEIADKKRTPFRLYRVANWYYSGQNKAMSTQAKEIASDFIPYCRNKYGRRESCLKIDPACKALRKELELFGLDAQKADNNGRDIRGNRSGIEVGVENLQSAIEDGRFFLVECQRYGHADFLREIGLYCVDDHGKPVDAYNHAMDEARYANNYFYKNYVI